MADLTDLPPPPPELLGQDDSVSLESLPPPPEDIASLPPPPQELMQEAPTPDMSTLPAPTKEVLDSSKEYIRRSAKVASTIGDTAMFGLSMFDVPRRVLVGNIIKRLDPEAYQKVTTALKMKGMDPDNLESLTEAEQALNEYAPDLYAGTYVNKFITDKIPGAIGKTAGFIGGLATDILTDPLTYITFGASTAKGFLKGAATAKKEAQILKEAKEANKVGEVLTQHILTKSPTVRPFIEQVADGERALVSLKLPFVDKPLLNVTGPRAAKIFDRVVKVDALAKAKRAMPFLQMSTNNFIVDDALKRHALSDTALEITKKELNEVLPDVTNNVAEAVVAIENYGPEKARSFLKTIGVNVSDADFVAAQKAQAQYAGELSKANELARSVGIEAPTYKGPDKAEVEQLAKGLEDMGIELPKELKPYIAREQYGLPRKMKKEAAMAKASIDTEISAWEKSISGGSKLKFKPDAYKESEKYSQIVMDLVKGKETGFARSFVTNPKQRVIDTIVDIKRSALDKKLVDDLMEFGGTQKEMIAKIKDAKKAVRDGMPVDEITASLAKMDANDLTNIGEYPWEKISAYIKPLDKETKGARKLIRKLDKDGFGEVDINDALMAAKSPPGAYAVRENIYFPKEIVTAIENRFGSHNDPNVIMAGLGWVNDVWRKSVLTNHLRLPREMVENTAAYMMARGDVSELPRAAWDTIKYGGVEALSNTLKWTGDAARKIGLTKAGRWLDKTLDPNSNVVAEIFFNSNYAETISSYGAKYVDEAMPLKEALSLDAANSKYWSELQDVAKTGQKGALKELLGINKLKASDLGKMALKAPGAAANLLFDNPIAKTIRSFSGGASQNMAKLALTRTYMKKGLPLYEAMDKANRHLISFSDLNKSIQPSRLAIPFAAYHLRNAQRLPLLIAATPAGVNLYDKMEQALNRWHNIGPEESVAFKSVFGGKFNPNPLFGGFLQGTEELQKNPSMWNEWSNKIAEAVYGPEALKEYADAGQVLALKFPDPFMSSMDLLGSDVSSLAPVVKASIALLGKDPITGKDIPYSGTVMEQKQALDKILSLNGGILNPIAANQIYKLGTGLFRGMAKEYHERLLNEEDPENAVSELVYRQLFGKDKGQALLNKRKSAIANMYHNFSLGTGFVNDFEMAYFVKIKALENEIKTIERQFASRAKYGKANNEEAQEMEKSLTYLSNKIEFNAEMYSRVEEAMAAFKASYPNFEQEIDAHEEQMNQLKEENNKQLEQLRQDMEAPKVEDNVDEVSSYSQDMNRSPAMEAPGLIERGSELTKKYLKPKGPVEEASAPEQRAGLNEQWDASQNFNMAAALDSFHRERFDINEAESSDDVARTDLLLKQFAKEFPEKQLNTDRDYEVAIGLMQAMEDVELSTEDLKEKYGKVTEEYLDMHEKIQEKEWDIKTKAKFLEYYNVEGKVPKNRKELEDYFKTAEELEGEK